MCDCPISCFRNKQAYICLYFQCNINAIFVKYYFTCYIFSIRKFFNSYRIIVMYILFWNFPLCTSSLSPISHIDIYCLMTLCVILLISEVFSNFLWKVQNNLLWLVKYNYKINFTAWLLLKNSSVVNCFDGFEIKFWFELALLLFWDFSVHWDIYMYQTISTALVSHLDWSSSELNFWSLSVRVEEKTLNFC